jgi:hypothetical protein
LRHLRIEIKPISEIEQFLVEDDMGHSFGHILRMEKPRLPLKALHWTPPGKRKPGKHKGTWRRTLDQER